MQKQQCKPLKKRKQQHNSLLEKHKRKEENDGISTDSA
jgi:hypothetical protein